MHDGHKNCKQWWNLTKFWVWIEIKFALVSLSSEVAAQTVSISQSCRLLSSLRGADKDSTLGRRWRTCSALLQLSSDCIVVLCCVFCCRSLGGGSLSARRLSLIRAGRRLMVSTSRWMGDKLGLTVEEMPFTSPPPSAQTIMLLAEHNQYTHLLFQPLFSVSALAHSPRADVIFLWSSLIHSRRIVPFLQVPGASWKMVNVLLWSRLNDSITTLLRPGTWDVDVWC